MFYKKKKSSSLKKITSNISWLASDKMLELFLTLIVGVFIARYLGPASLGKLNYSLAFIALCMPLAQLGLANIVVRSIVESPGDSGEILGTSIILQLISGIVIGSAVVSFVWFFSPVDELVSWFISLLALTVLLRSTDVIKWWNQSQVASKYTVWANRTGMLIAVLIKLWLIWTGSPLEYFIWAWIVQSVVTTILLILIYKNVFNGFQSWKFSGIRAKQLLANGWPLLFTSVASIIYLKIDVVMLGSLASSYEVGIYSAAAKLSELWYFIPGIVVGSLFPAIIRSKKLAQENYFKRIQALFDLMSLYSFVVIAFTLILAPYVIFYLYGEKFLGAVSILRVHACALIFVATGVTRNRWFIADNRTRFIMFATMIGAVVNVVANWLLIPAFGGLGAAWATVLSYGIATYLTCILWKPVWDPFLMMSKSYLVFFRPGSLVKFVKESAGLR